MSNSSNLQRAYQQWVARVKATAGPDVALKQAIGGEFEAIGIIEMMMLRFFGLAPHHSLIDVGCGSGRLAIPLSRSHEGRYLGTDLVPDLLAFARESCNRPDWRFEAVTGLEIPAQDDTADMICMFSVLTHLLHEQSFLYLEEAKRVLKPNGTIVFSFLEFQTASHWAPFEKTIEYARSGFEHPLNVFIDRNGIRAWADHIGLDVVEIRSGDEPFVPLTEPVTFENGSVMSGLGTLGQSVCVLAKGA